MAARRRPIGWIALAGLFGFMALVVYRSLHMSGIRCEVCITFHDRSMCRTVDGEREEDVMMAATTNACAYLANGVTEGMACSRTPPTKADCQVLP